MPTENLKNGHTNLIYVCVQKKNLNSKQIYNLFTVLDAITTPNLNSFSCFSHMNLLTQGWFFLY